MIKKDYFNTKEERPMKIIRLFKGKREELLRCDLQGGKVEIVVIAHPEAKETAITIAENLQKRGIPTSHGVAFPKDGHLFLEGLQNTLRSPVLFVEPFDLKTSG